MSRLHAALSRATDGKAPIVPASVEAVSREGPETSQPGFSDPWKLDAAEPPAPSSAAEPHGGPASQRSDRGFASLAVKPADLSQSREGEKLVGSATPESDDSLAVAAEQYRKLVATMHHAQAERAVKVIMVTSANPGEGKSLTASNLALTLSDSYQRRVLLIDGDLRRPSLHDTFGIPNQAGLTDGLARHSKEQIVVREIGPRLSILPSGKAVDDPTGALTCEQMRRLLDEARTRFDWTIIDTPPVGLVSDAKLLSEMVDGVVLVVEAGKSAYPDLLRAIESIGRDRLMGVVLNRIRGVPGRSYYSSYYRRPKEPGA